jgi:3-hydroxybutyryl-CoA dehydrogenase
MSVIGVIGAGTMGRGVVSVFAANGYEVILLDLSQEVLAEAQKGIKNMLRFRQVAKRTGEDGKPESDEIVLSRIEFTTDHEKLERSDFIVENINENYELKKQIYLQIDKICRKDVIFAVNTSCISITKIAALTSRPEQIIGTHFMNPVGMIHAVEVIKGFTHQRKPFSRPNRFLKVSVRKALLCRTRRAL